MDEQAKRNEQEVVIRTGIQAGDGGETALGSLGGGATGTGTLGTGH